MKTLLLILMTAFPSQKVDEAIHRAIDNYIIPGAVLCYVDADTIAYFHAYGHRSIVPNREMMTIGTIFDLASVSKPVGVGTAALNLIKEGKLHVDNPVAFYLPGFQSTATIRHLMEHTSGLPPYMNAKVLERIYNERKPFSTTQAFLLDTICRCKRLSEPGEKYTYSCLNFITLQFVVESITGMSLAKIRPYYRPIDMENCPVDDIAPTEQMEDGHVLRGDVHDPLARIMMRGISGNAGVFMSAGQLAQWCIRFMNLPEEVRTSGVNAGLWTDEDGSLNHTGYTGTSIRLYPRGHRALILLTNRVHPIDKGSLSELRRELVIILSDAGFL